METDPIVNLEQKTLQSLGMDGRTDVAEIRITILPRQLPHVTIVTELVNPAGIEPFFTYVAEHYDLVPNNSHAEISALETDQPE